MKLAPRHLALIATLALSLTACGSGSGNDSAAPSTPADESSQTSTPPQTASSSQTDRSSEPADGTSGRPEDTSSPAPHSAMVEEGVVPANPGPEDIPGFIDGPAAGQDPAQQGQGGQPEQPYGAGQDQGQPAQTAPNSAGLSDEALAHFQAGGACFSDAFPAGIPSALALQEIQAYCATTDPAEWDLTDGIPNPFGVPDPVR